MTRDAYDVMDLKALRCFWATARRGSLTQAGIDLGISEAAVSQRLKALERHLGVKLYESRGGRIYFTSAGDGALEFAVDLFDRIAVFETSVVEHGVGGTITVATSGLISRYLLPDAVKRFNDTYPKARLRLLHRSPGEIVKAVRLNEVDLGLVHAVHMPEGVAFHPWKTFPAFVLLSRDHPLSRDGTPKFRELLNLDTVTRYPLIAPEIDDPQQYRVAKVLRDEGLPYNVGLEVGSFETVKHYVALGQGIAVVPGACLTEEDHHAFATIRIPDEFHGDTIYGIVLRTDKHLTGPLSGMLGILGISLGSK